MNKHLNETNKQIESAAQQHSNELSAAHAETTTPKYNTEQKIMEDNPLPDERGHCSTFKTDLNLMIKKMKNASINFNLKYLSANTLPRKVIFDIKQDIQNMFLNPLSHIVELLESSGFITAEGKIMLDEIIGSSNNNETEYKFVEQLKGNDLYAEPREFILSNELCPGIVQNEQQMSNDPITGNKCSQLFSRQIN